MHLTLTDHLTCPRCGPSAGLILMMEQATERRVVAGSLGCPRCRTRYPIERKVADLRTAEPRAGREAGGGRPGGDAPAGATGREEPELALRVAALLGLSEGRGFLLVDGPRGLEVARGLHALLRDYEVVVPIGEADAETASEAELSAILDSGPLPITGRAMRAVAWVGPVPDEARLHELVRVCRPTGRIVVETGDAGQGLDGVAAVLTASGAEVRARDATGLVAAVL